MFLPYTKVLNWNLSTGCLESWRAEELSEGGGFQGGGNVLTCGSEGVFKWTL